MTEELDSMGVAHIISWQEGGEIIHAIATPPALGQGERILNWNIGSNVVVTTVKNFGGF